MRWRGEAGSFARWSYPHPQPFSPTRGLPVVAGGRREQGTGRFFPFPVVEGVQSTTVFPSPFGGRWRVATDEGARRSIAADARYALRVLLQGVWYSHSWMTAGDAHFSVDRHFDAFLALIRACLGNALFCCLAACVFFWKQCRICT